MNRLGPNHRQVEGFLRRLRQLTAEQWQEAQDREARSRAAFGDPDAEIARTTYPHFEDWVNASGKLLERDGVPGNSRLFFVALRAVMGLAICGALNKTQFAAHYSPFSRVIPVQTLGEGLAPEIPELPTEDYQYFLLRVEGLRQEWNDVINIADAQDLASGPEGIEDVFESVRNRLLQWLDARDIDRTKAEAMLAAVDSIDQIVFAGFSAARQAWSILQRALDRPLTEAATAYADAFAPKEELARYVTRGAVFALIARHLISETEFFTLYLPFSSVVPLDSLTPKVTL